MAYNKAQSPTDWTNKEKRELFCKATNSMLMSTPEAEVIHVLKVAKIIVDTAFTNYPDRAEEDAKSRNPDAKVIDYGEEVETIKDKEFS